MKVRIDYVSNSSSSSFMVLGSKYTPKDGRTLTIEDFDNLEGGEMFFAVYPDICEGDYVIKLTPELMMEFDMRQKPIVLDERSDNVKIYKIRKFRRNDYDSGVTFDAADWGECHATAHGKQVPLERLPRKNGEQLFSLMADDHSPNTQEEILFWLESRNK